MEHARSLFTLQVISMSVANKHTLNVKWMQTMESQSRDPAGIWTSTSHWREMSEISWKNWQWTWKTLKTLYPPLFFLVLFVIHAVWSGLKPWIWYWTVIMSVKASVWWSTSTILVLGLALSWRTAVHWRWWVRALYVRFGRTLLLAKFGTSVLEPDLRSDHYDNIIRRQLSIIKKV